MDQAKKSDAKVGGGVMELFELPRAMGEESEMDSVNELILRVEARVKQLRLQQEFFSLRAALRKEGAQVARFRYHIQMEQSEDYVEIEIHYKIKRNGLDEYGVAKSSENPSRCGALAKKDARFEELRDYLTKSGLRRRLEDLWVECEDEAKLARFMMGEKGYALYEAEQIERQAGGPKPAGGGPSRI